MAIEPGSVEHLSEIISHVVAPAFMLSAVASFVSLLSNRLVTVIDRIRDLSIASSSEAVGVNSHHVIKRLQTRARVLNLAIFFGLLSAVSALILIIASFVAALLPAHHVWIAAVLFIVSSFFLLCAVITFCVDARMGMRAHDLH